MSEPLLGDPMFILSGLKTHMGISGATPPSRPPLPTKLVGFRSAPCSNARPVCGMVLVQKVGSALPVVADCAHSNDTEPSESNHVCPFATCSFDCQGATGCNEMVSATPCAQAPRQEVCLPTGVESRWWSASNRVCPLTGFPISMLPYPPFKLRDGAGTSFELVDGKYLALQLIVSGQVNIRGRKLQACDVTSLDGYMRRCKLGPFRIATAAALQEKMRTASCHADKARDQLKLEVLRTKALRALEKLRFIQKTRMLSIQLASSR
mmetsp:Transcript_47586/g.120909  ORF Transcript_47586/g.120909 Transcript_47586/m.120909 type:complete len:265 (-) Transcript_47586:11-805(-)